MPAQISSPYRKSIRFFRRPFAVSILLGLFCFLVYNANLRQIGSGDTLPARYQPLILWHHGTLNLDAEARIVAHGHSMTPAASADGGVNYFEAWTYWMIRGRENHVVSVYPVVTPLLVAPLYFPAVIWLNAHGWEPPNIDRVAELMEKLSASILASIACVLMYLVLRRDGNRWSLPLALVFAFGTNTWMISSQALWQHGTGELLIALALLLVAVPASSMRTAILGAVCALMAANRPPDGLIAGAIVLFIVWSRGRNALWLLAGAALPLTAFLYYNFNFAGSVFGGYALAKTQAPNFFQLSWSGVPGLLVSPTRGLLIFSPFLIFIPVGLIQRLRSPTSRGLAVALSLAVVAQFLLYSQADWRAGVSWGPRWLTDLLPVLVWMLAPAPLVLRWRTRRLLIVAMTASVLVQLSGAFWYTKASDARIFANPTSMRGAWNPRNLPFLLELRHPRPHGALLCGAVGSIDRVGPALLPGAGEPPVLEPGAVLQGTALTCGAAPARVLLLIDGIVVGSTADFLPRADGNQITQANLPASWHVSADTRGVTLGEHVLQLGFIIRPGNDIRIICEQRVNVTAQQSLGEAAPLEKSASDLNSMATRATSLLRARQSGYGFWLTSYTNELRYQSPQQEMNTYLTSMLVDLLLPIARQRSLNDLVERARQHLTKQIESNGLVRYHGLPNGPTIGALGAVITPDADDTALVWRIAGPGAADPRKRLMLTELARYRDARGLYRTWLAPQTEYQNIDPGRDPNPADVAIQMHVYLMLHEFDPPSAQNLCDALRRSFDDNSIWVYYDKAPLVPYLRAVELQRLGCAIPSPTARLAQSAPGQDVWSEAARRLVATMSSPSDANARQEIGNLLLRLGNDDFAAVRRSPPLLYHNDLSATVKRFYWSEDFGYALWLRLYEAAGVAIQKGQGQSQ